jgi:hypothetical protein
VRGVNAGSFGANFLRDVVERGREEHCGGDGKVLGVEMRGCVRVAAEGRKAGAIGRRNIVNRFAS